MVASAVAVVYDLSRPLGGSSAASDGPVGVVPAVTTYPTLVSNTTLDELNLLNGSSVNELAAYDGYFDTSTSAFPATISGGGSYPAWSKYSKILELAPGEGTESNDHSAGVAMVKADAGLTVSLRADTTYAWDTAQPAGGGIGDGVELYLYMSPTNVKNWSLRYYATGDANGTFMPSQGSVIFPYATAPYIVVQWDPAYAVRSPTHPPQGGFNIYLVRPDTSSGDTVSKSDITTLPSNFGNGSAQLPHPGDLLDFVVSYSVETAALEGTVTDLNDTALKYSFASNLETADKFAPAYAPATSYYFGVGGSGNHPTAWGVLSLSANVTPPPSGDTEVEVSSSLTSCGAWFESSSAGYQSAPGGSILGVKSGNTIDLEADPSCDLRTWDVPAGAQVATPYSLENWTLSGDAKATSGESLTGSTLAVKVTGVGSIYAQYAPSSTQGPFDPGWVGYAGDAAIYPTQDTQPYVLPVETSQAAQSTWGLGNQGVLNIPYTNNTIAAEAQPAFAYNATLHQFQVVTVTTINSEEWDPCYLATYGNGSDPPSLYDDAPDSPLTCLPVAFMNYTEKITGVPSSSFTNVTGLFGVNTTACGTTNSSSAGESVSNGVCTTYIPQGTFDYTEYLGPLLSHLFEGIAILTELEALAIDATLEAALTLDLFFLHTVVSFLLSPIGNDIASLVFAGIACALSVIGCFTVLPFTILGVLFSFFGIPVTTHLSPWNGFDMTSHPNATGNGTITEAVATDEGEEDNGSDYGEPYGANRTLWNCWSDGGFSTSTWWACGNDTFQEGIVSETAINEGSLASVTDGSMTIGGSNEMWKWWADEVGPGGNYVNWNGYCSAYDAYDAGGDPCALPGATITTPISYLVRPAVSIGGTIAGPGGVPLANSTLTLTQLYDNSSTVFTVPTNAKGYWHFFAEPGATYSYTVTQPGGAPSAVFSIPSYYTDKAATGTNETVVTPLSVQFLGGYAATPVEDGWSHAFSFTVPSAISHVLLVWTFNSDTTATVSLPAGLTIEEEFGNSTGIAFGALAPGNYSASFSGGSGWVNTASIAVYGVANDNGYDYRFGEAPQAKSLTLPSGGSAYLGVLETGGVPLTNASLTTVNEEATVPSGYTGYTDLIGSQSSGTFSFTANAAGYGIAAVAITGGPSPSPLTIDELAGVGVAPQYDGWSTYFSFGVPSGTSHVLLVWTFNSDTTATVSLPTGLTIEEEFGNSTGIAFGALAPGNYSAYFSGGSGWVNTASMAAFGIFNDSSYGYAFGGQSLAMRLALPAGGSDYFGVLETGGVPVTNASLTTVNVEAPVPVGYTGYTDLIGQQSSNILSFTTKAAGYGLAGAAITSGLAINVPAVYNATPGDTNGELSETLRFTVPSGVSHELVLWTVSDTTAATSITLPTGLTVEEEFGNLTGIAFGTLPAGSYSVVLSGNGGWVNAATIAVYEISNDNGYDYQFADVSEATSLTLPSGGGAYLGVLETGGALPLTDASLTTINAETPSQDGGETDLIGQQASATFSFTTTAAGYGLAAVGIYDVN